MRYQIILEGNDLKEDVEEFVAFVEQTGIASAFAAIQDDADEAVLSVDKIQLVINP